MVRYGTLGNGGVNSFLLVRMHCTQLVLQKSLCAFSTESQVPLAMDQLPAYGVNLGLSKQAFIHLLKHHHPSSLRGLRTSLTGEADSLDLIPSELCGLPLVNRRDSVLRPVTNVLGKDMWTISKSIVNRTSVPRVLFKHGKRSREYINSVSHSNSSATTHSQPQTIMIPLLIMTVLQLFSPVPWLFVNHLRAMAHLSHIVSLYLQALMCPLISSIEKLIL